ncbi:HAMP domain-containing histidine kinase [Archangium minus]|uniref:histidine kinase n=1 Tax=Archangium minus TaxID=83450 RepID=A0ABY9X2R1_9BACT|nr:HAMP domain-containing histidine kinase [Archangium minus]
MNLRANGTAQATSARLRRSRDSICRDWLAVVFIEDCDQEARFCVKDTGPGIKEADLPHVFDAYWQAEHTKGTGAGLGLAIAKGIIEGHGGRIWVESAPGAGAAFYFTLPTKKRDKRSGSAEEMGAEGGIH